MVAYYRWIWLPDFLFDLRLRWAELVGSNITL